MHQMAFEIWISFVNPEMKDSFNVNLKKELICWDELPWVNRGHNFMNNKNLVAMCWWGAPPLLCILGRTSDWTQLSMLCPAYSHSMNQPLPENLGFIFLPTEWDLPRPIRTTQTAPTFASILTNQKAQFAYFIYIKCTQLGTWTGTFSV